MTQIRVKFHTVWLRLKNISNQFTAGGAWTDQLQPPVRQNLRAFWFDGLFASASEAVVGTFQTLYLLALGATNAQIGFLSSISSLSGVLILLPGALLTERIGRRKDIALYSGGVFGRLVMLLMIFIPVFFSGQAAVFMAILLSFLRDALNNLGLPAWISLSADLVPLAWRGRYFGSRNFIMGLSAMAATYIFGVIISNSNQLQGYQLAYVLALLLGALSTLSFSRIKEPASPGINSSSAIQKDNSFSTLELWKNIRSHPVFLIYCLTSAIWNFSLNISGPFFAPYQVKVLGATATMVGILTISSQLTSMLTQQPFGSLSDRFGPRRVVMLTGFLIPILPIAWLFIQNAWQAIPVNLVGGALWAGYSLASFNFLLLLTPEDQRARFSAIYQIVVALSLSAGAFVGSFVVTKWGYFAVFAASGVGRMVAAILFSHFVRPVEVES